MVENTVERETQPGRRQRERTLEEHAIEMQRLIAAAREIVGGNDEDAADLIIAVASCVRDRRRPLAFMSEADCLVRDLRQSLFGG